MYEGQLSLCAEAGCRRTWSRNHTIWRLSQRTKHSHINITTLSRLAWCAITQLNDFLFSSMRTLKRC